VLFDLDDTLFAHREAVARAITAHRSQLGADRLDDALEVERWRALEELHYHRYLAGEISFSGQRRARAREFAANYGQDLAIDAAADAWFDGYRQEYEAVWMLHDDAIDCLTRIRATGTLVGIITNGELAFQAEKVDRLGLSPVIDGLVASGAVGFTKPDPRIFELACARLGVATSAAVYVGDRLGTDAIGAARAGLRGVWLNRSGDATAAEFSVAEASGIDIISSLNELEGLG